MTHNRARGEARATIEGREYTLLLNMDALARIETALGATSLADVGMRLAMVTTEGLMSVIGILLAAGGNPVDRATMGAWSPSAVVQMRDALRAVFEASGLGGDGAESDAPKSTSRSLGESGSAPAALPPSEAA